MLAIIDSILSYSDARFIKGVSAKTINEAQNSLELKFSKDYYIYIRKFGIASVNAHELTGICKSKRLNVVDVTKANRELFNDIPDDWYVIEEAHIDGIVIWQSTDGKIYQTMPGREPIMIAESLAEYISM